MCQLRDVKSCTASKSDVRQAVDVVGPDPLEWISPPPHCVELMPIRSLD